ncbi:MAG: hypothetical protein Unbinned1502contig1001_2 [Prokaryotic dsDNA virus sp.]|nr:MAG: hypothetical protein Unbinned1502contig1001_2 [Prokaryotic dsDNA virus sp.]|tara:strand:+ start:1730 stop:2134 length:405 start_codon:yes stop_codon:yes gene_type:complete
MSAETWSIKNADQRKALIDFINQNADSEVTFSITRGQRTNKQNNALHAYLRDVSEQMCARGMDMREVLKPTVEITPTMQIVKDYMWKPIQEKVLDKASTADLTTQEVDMVYQVISKHLAEKFDIVVPFGRSTWE